MRKVRPISEQKKKGCRNPRKGNPYKDDQYAELSKHLLKSHGIYDKTHHQQRYIDRKCLIGIRQLNSIIEVLQTESVNYPNDLPISFDCVEMAIAISISQLLHGSASQTSDILKTRSLLRDYKVFGFLPKKKPTLSLGRIHQLCQDNYPDSSLCILLNIALAGHLGVISKTISF